MENRLTTAEIISNLTKDIDKRISELHWSFSRLAAECNMSYDSVKKIMSGKNENPSFHTIITICQVLDIGLDHAIYPDLSSKNNSSINSIKPLHQDNNDTPRIQGIHSHLVSLEKILKEENKLSQNQSIPILYPIGNNTAEDMSAEAFSITTIPSKNYYKLHGDKLAFGMEVTTHCYSPTYFYGDILLIGNHRLPHEGEVGVYEYNGKYLLRRCNTNEDHEVCLAPLHNIGKCITEKDMKKIHPLGYVLGVYR